MATGQAWAITILIWAVPTVLAIVFHEVMHGRVALRFGDDTAAQAGRLTFNPVRHIDPFGTIILPAVLLFLRLPVFGYAKPVPVDFRRLTPRRAGMIAVAAAGPLTNFAIAAGSAFALRLMLGSILQTGTVVYVVMRMLEASVAVNVMLGVFNLLPLLPLDGGRVVAGLMPLAWARPYARMERFGFLILFLLLYSGWFIGFIDKIVGTITRTLLS